MRGTKGMRGRWTRPDNAQRALAPIDRFMAKTAVQTNGCWLWTASLDEKGYGRFWDGRRQRKAHAWAYEHFVGPIPDGLEPDHTCRVRACVNWRHIEPVTHRVNSQRAAYAKATCDEGHPLPSPGPDGRRVCRPCANRRNREYKARLRAAKACFEAVMGRPLPTQERNV